MANRKLIAMWTVAALAGCATNELIDDPDLVEPGTLPVYGPPVEGMETQGRYLLGFTLDQLGGDPIYHFTVGPEAFDPIGRRVTIRYDARTTLLGVDGTGRTLVGADPGLLGLRLPINGGDGGDLKLVSARISEGYGVYALRFRGPAATTWTDPCDGKEAMPIAGRWTRKGEHEAGPGFTFACIDGGVAAKCSAWGYPSGDLPGSLMWRGNQACTRMARFDLCRNGTSLTRAGTMITIYDNLGINNPPPAMFEGVSEWPPPVSRFYYEASWTIFGPICLGKLRWQSLAFGGPCPVELPDPRIDPNAAFCPDLPTQDDDVLLVNTGRYNELALHVWRRGDDLVSTVRGFQAQGHTVEPFPDYAHVTIDAMLLRAPTDVLEPGDLRAVRLFIGPNGDRVVTSVAPPGYADGGHEGYVLTSQLGQSIPLREYGNGVDRLTTTRDPPAGYSWLRDVGFVIPL